MLAAELEALAPWVLTQRLPESSSRAVISREDEVAH